MSVGLLYDNIALPQKVSDILEHDFWVFRNVALSLVKSVTSPVKMSAYTSIFLSKGSCTVDINLIKHKIQAPCFINMRSSHIMQPTEISEDFEASFMVISKRMTDALLGCINDISLISVFNRHNVVPVSAEVSDALNRLYDDLVDISSDQSVQKPFNTVLYTLAAFILRYGNKCYERFVSSSKGSGGNHITDKFLFLVQENFKKERFLEFYADKLEISPKHLSRTIKEQTGYTAVEWINRFIILEAKVMLKSSNLNIQQIADELNFPSQSFFGKYFKKATGLSPKDFRNS